MGLIEMVDALPKSIVIVAFAASCYPLAKWVLPHISSVKTAAFLHILIGLLNSFLLFGMDFIIPIIIAFVSYPLLNLQGCHCFFISSIIAISVSIYTYIKDDSWNLDVTCQTMCMFERIASLGFNCSDGRKRKNGEKIDRKAWNDVALDDIPPFINYFAYLFTPFGSFTNPFIEYKVFEKLLERGQRDDISEREHKEALRKFIGAILHAIVVQIALTYIDYDIYSTKFFMAIPPPLRFLFTTVTTSLLALRYFPMWWFVEAGFYEGGLASNGIVDEDCITNYSMLYAFGSTTISEWMRRWNHTTHLFFKNYIYIRLRSVGWSAFQANLAVTLASSVWHGARPILYLMLPENIINERADNAWNSRYPQKEDDPAWLTYLHRFFVIVMMMYGTVTWYFPTAHQFFELRSKLWFLPPLVSLVMLIYFTLTKSHKKAKKE